MTNEKKPMRRYTKKKAERAERLLRLPPDLDAAVIEKAAAHGDSITETIITLIRKGLGATDKQ